MFQSTHALYLIHISTQVIFSKQFRTNSKHIFSSMHNFHLPYIHICYCLNKIFLKLSLRVCVMLGLHIATLRYECHESPFVTEDHEFDLNLMFRTRSFTNCRDLLRCVTTNARNFWRIVTNHYAQSRILSLSAYEVI